MIYPKLKIGLLSYRKKLATFVEGCTPGEPTCYITIFGKISQMKKKLETKSKTNTLFGFSDTKLLYERIFANKDYYMIQFCDEFFATRFYLIWP